VIIDKESDSLIICEYGNRRVVRWHRRSGTNGEIIISNVNCWALTIVAGGNEEGNIIHIYYSRQWH
jgi:hypothetical protein